MELNYSVVNGNNNCTIKASNKYNFDYYLDNDQLIAVLAIGHDGDNLAKIICKELPLQIKNNSKIEYEHHMSASVAVVHAVFTKRKLTIMNIGNAGVSAQTGMETVKTDFHNLANVDELFRVANAYARERVGANVHMRKVKECKNLSNCTIDGYDITRCFGGIKAQHYITDDMDVIEYNYSGLTQVKLFMRSGYGEEPEQTCATIKFESCIDKTPVPDAFVIGYKFPHNNKKEFICQYSHIYNSEICDYFDGKNVDRKYIGHLLAQILNISYPYLRYKLTDNDVKQRYNLIVKYYGGIPVNDAKEKEIKNENPDKTYK